MWFFELMKVDMLSIVATGVILLPVAMAGLWYEFNKEIF